MSNDDFDLSDTLAAKSDQLNADDLVGGSITVQILDAKRGDSTEQPVVYRLSGDSKPWKPCKTVRRILASVTGSTMARAPIGRWVRLYRDPDVQWAGKPAGGIRLEAISGIDRPHTIVLATSGKTKKEYRIVPLTPPTTAPPVASSQQSAPGPADLAPILSGYGLTVADLDAAAAAKGTPAVADLDAGALRRLVAFLRSPAGEARLSSMQAEKAAGGGQ